MSETSQLPRPPQSTATTPTPIQQDTRFQKNLKIGMLLVLFAASFNLGIRWNEYQVGKWKGYLDNTIEQQAEELRRKDKIIKTSRDKVTRSHRAADKLLASLKQRKGMR